MAIIVKDGGGSSRLLEEGIYLSVCTQLIDLGMQYSEKYGRVSRRISIGWDLVDETYETKEGEAFNRTLRKEYSTTLGEKSSLRKDLQTWRGKVFTPEELAGFNMENVLGVPCQLQVIHTQKNGNTYANVASVLALSKGMERPTKEYRTLRLDLEEPETFGTFSKLTPYLQDRIRKAENFISSGLPEYLGENLPGQPEYMEELGFQAFQEEELPF